MISIAFIAAIIAYFTTGRFWIAFVVFLGVSVFVEKEIVVNVLDKTRHVIEEELEIIDAKSELKEILNKLVEERNNIIVEEKIMPDKTNIECESLDGLC